VRRVGGHAGRRPGGAEEGLGRRKVARVTEPHIDQVPVPINRPLEVAPLTLNTYVCFVHVPAIPYSATTPLTQSCAEAWSQLALPLPHGFMRKHDTPLEKHFRDIWPIDVSLRLTSKKETCPRETKT
jgi:hypothetical protein